MDRNRSDSKYPRLRNGFNIIRKNIHIISDIEIVQVHRKNGFAEKFKILAGYRKVILLNFRKKKVIFNQSKNSYVRDSSLKI